MNILSIPGRVCRLLIPCCLFGTMAVTNALADDDSAASSDADSDEYFQLEKCIQTSQLRNTEIIDDRTIIFHMRHQKIFVKHLPHRCFGLRMAGAFSYRSVTARLCDIDTIRVVNSFDRQPDAGPSCGLGKFRPVTEEEVEMLKNKEAEKPPQAPEPDEDSDEEGAD